MMGENSAIQWTHHTFNPWIGCTKVSAGCAHCYAEQDMDKRRHRVKWGDAGTRSVTGPDNWSKPKKWNKAAKASGQRMRVFCASLADVFEDWKGPLIAANGETVWYCESCHHIFVKEFDCPACGSDETPGATLDDIRAMLFELIDETPWLDWMLLTKRPENIRRMWHGGPRRNVWLGTSVENQEAADKRIPHLNKLGDLSPCLFLSCEPLLGPVNLTRKDNGGGELFNSLSAEVTTHEGHIFQVSDAWPMRLVIVGLESDQGEKARGCEIGVFDSLIRQCSDSRTCCFIKQLGSDWARRMNLRDKHGGDISEWPQELRVRQMPEVPA